MDTLVVLSYEAMMSVVEHVHSTVSTWPTPLATACSERVVPSLALMCSLPRIVDDARVAAVVFIDLNLFAVALVAFVLVVVSVACIHWIHEAIVVDM